MPLPLRWLRDVARDGAADLLWRSGATRPHRALAGRLTIVTFHRVLPPERRAHYPLPHLAVPPALFDELLRWFAATFECLPLAAAVAATATRAQQTGRPLLAVTFDDGLRDNHEFALPLLRRHAVRATFFAVADHARSGALLWHDRLAYAAAHAAGGPLEEVRRRLLEVVPSDDVARLLSLLPAAGAGVPAFAHAVVRRAKQMSADVRDRFEQALAASRPGAAIPAWEGMMDFAQLRALAAEGHEVGSHSLSHALLRTELRPDFVRETAGSRALLEDAIGAPVRSFCYPDGAHDEAAVAAVRAAGYVAAVTTLPGTNRPADDPFRLRRQNVEAEANQTRDGSLAIARLALRLSRPRGRS
jgi:peptidoglycan/xylan/chitin deacetylase (PgdA/CDA1 family)